MVLHTFPNIAHRFGPKSQFDNFWNEGVMSVSRNCFFPLYEMKKIVLTDIWSSENLGKRNYETIWRLPSLDIPPHEICGVQKTPNPDNSTADKSHPEFFHQEQFSLKPISTGKIDSYLRVVLVGVTLRPA